MRIAYITMEYIDPSTHKIIDGGLANYLYKVTNTLANMGHEITVFVVYSPVDKHIKYNNIDIYYISGTCFQKTFWQKLYWTFLPKKVKKKIKAKFSHQETLHRKIQELNAKKPFDIIQYTTCTFMANHPEKNIPSCVRISSYAKLRQKFYSYTNLNEIQKDNEIYERNRFIFGPSKHIANYIENDLKLENKIKIIESPYSNAKIEENNEILKDLREKIGTNPYLLFFGTIGELKGCGTIARCIYNVLNKYPNLYFVLVGKKANWLNLLDYEKLIRENAKEYSSRIIRYPSQPHEKLYPIIKNSIGVLMPSLTENFSNACVEAMRLRKIVIGTEGNFSQLIEDEINGFLTKVNDSNSLKEKIFKLIELPKDKKEEMEKKAFQRTEELSPENICNQLLKYYDFVIKNWKK